MLRSAVVGRNKGDLNLKAVIGNVVPPSDGSDSWQEAKPVGKENEDKERREQAEGTRDHVLAHNALEHVVKELHDSFEGVLVTAGNQLHILRCAARPPKDHQHDDGCHEHGIR